MERLKVTKEIEVAEQHDEFSLAEFTNKFLKLAETIPEQYLGTAKVEMESLYTDWCKLIITWEEPEPEEEFQKRQQHAADNLKRVEAEERNQYEALKKKFEGKV